MYFLNQSGKLESLIFQLSTSVSLSSQLFSFPSKNLCLLHLYLKAVVNFLIIALVVFMFIKIINTASAKFKREEGIEIEEVEVPVAEQYLKDIRDLLAKEK